MSQHAAVWIDHVDAHIFRIEDTKVDESILHAPHHVHRHPKPQTNEKFRPEDERVFFHAVARALDGAQEILVVGPASGKLQFLRHLHQHDPAIEARVVGIETVDHPTNRQIVAYAREYFAKIDGVRTSA